MTEEQISQLVINKLSEDQYQQLKVNGQLNENEIYLTDGPDSFPGGFTQVYSDGRRFLTGRVYDGKVEFGRIYKFNTLTSGSPSSTGVTNLPLNEDTTKIKITRLHSTYLSNSNNIFEGMGTAANDSNGVGIATILRQGSNQIGIMAQTGNFKSAEVEIWFIDK